MNLADKLILVDVDGVLLDWKYGFFRWMMDRGYTPVSTSSYRINKMFDIDDKLGYELGQRFNESAAIGWLPQFRDSVEYVKKLHEEGYVFHAITSLGNEEYAARLRKQNLAELFGSTVFEKVECLPFGGDKRKSLMPYANSGCIWVEDHVQNALLGNELGLNSILMKHEHNEGFTHDEITVVDNWKRIYSIINAA